MYTADFDAFMPILFQTDLIKAQTVWSTFMAGPMPPNMNVAVATLKANVNFQLLLRTIVDVFDCNYVLAQYLVFKGPIAFRNQIGTYADLKNCYRNVFGDYFLANIMDLYDRQLLWTHMFATHPAGFWADLLISVNPIEFGRIAFKYFPNEANQLMINANISITDYFSLIESYPGLGNAYLSNLKNTLMNMGYTAAGWTYLADEHHIYGSSRVGVHNTHFVLAKRFSTADMEYTQKTGNQVHFIRGKRNYELSNHLGNVQVVITDKRISVCDNELQTERFEADILMATDYYPFGMAIPERQWYTGSDSSNYRFGFNGKENDKEAQTQDYGMRIYNFRLGKFLSVDPLAIYYPMLTTYQFASNRPIDGIDLDGCEWKSIEGGFLWDPDNAYSDVAKTVLKPGYYHQAIHFSDQGTFTEKTEFNMGTSLATVYLADGSIKKFNACIYPARAAKYATTPEGEYEATVGMHRSSYMALHVHNKGNTGSESIELGGPNPSNPNVNTATGIHIHKAGIGNKTGLTSDNKPISAGCLLIDINNWNSFINIFNNKAQKNNIIGVQVSRSSEPALVEYCGENPNGSGVSDKSVKDNDIKFENNDNDLTWN